MLVTNAGLFLYHQQKVPTLRLQFLGLLYFEALDLLTLFPRAFIFYNYF